MSESRQIHFFTQIDTLFLRCSTNNKAKTVLELFEAAIAAHGQPSRVRSDFGTENVDVARYMLYVKGINRGSM